MPTILRMPKFEAYTEVEPSQAADVEQNRMCYVFVAHQTVLRHALHFSLY